MENIKDSLRQHLSTHYFSLDFTQKEEEAEDEYEELKQKQSSLKWKIEEQKDFLEKKRKAAE